MDKFEFCKSCSLLNCHLSVPKIEGKKRKSVFVVNDFPLIPPDERLVKSILEQVGVPLNEVHFTSALKCPVQGYKFKETDLQACEHILSKELEHYKPRFVIGLGNTPMFSFLNESRGNQSKRGKFYVVDKFGFTILYMPTFSIRAVYNDKENKKYRIFWDDFLAIGEAMADKFSWLDKKGEYYSIENAELAVKFIKNLHRYSELSIDVETTGFDEHTDDIITFGASFKEYTGASIPLKKKVDDNIVNFFTDEEQNLIWETIGEFLSDSSILKFIQNYTFEYRFLTKKLGYKIANVHDTMLFHHYYNPSTGDNSDSKGNRGSGGAKRLALSTIVSKYPDLSQLKDIWLPFSKKENKGKNLLDLYTPKQIAHYCSEDNDGTYRVGKFQMGRMHSDKFKSFFYDRICKIPEFVGDITNTGLNVDHDYIRNQIVVFDKETKQLKEEIQEIASKHGIEKFNPGSVTQLRKLLFDKMGYPDINNNSTDANTLDILKENHGCNIAEKILDYRRITKINGTYFKGIDKFINPVTGRVHANFKIGGAETGRISITKPALQTLPRKYSSIIKRMFIPSKGRVFIGADYSQIELRLIAWLSQDPVLLDAYNSGKDLHSLTASALFRVPFEDIEKWRKIEPKDDHEKEMKKLHSWYRDIGKNANFALCYGGSFMVLVAMVGNLILGPQYTKYDTVDEQLLHETASGFRDEYLNLYSGLEPWMERTVVQARKDGYVDSAYGFRRILPFINSTNKYWRLRDERKAINTDPQGTASFYCMFRFNDIINHSRSVGIGCDGLFPVHDAMYLEVDEDAKDDAIEIVRTVGVRRDESNITVPMILEPDIGYDLSQV